jgi:ATP-dependent DNA ligase
MPAHFDDGEALFTAVQEQGLEGVVAKRLEGRYRPGKRDWIKTKNRAYWRYPLELEAARQAARRRQRVTI